MIYQHINIPTYKRTSIPACKPITMVIYYIAGSIPLFRGKRSNHFRLQRQSKHGALCRLKGQAAAPFPDKSSSRFAASVFIGKTLYPTAPCKRAFENGNDRPAAHHRPKGKNNKGGGIRVSRRQGQPPPKGRRTVRRRVFTEKIP